MKSLRKTASLFSHSVSRCLGKHSGSILLLLALFLPLTPTALACTWYVDGVNGSDNNDCKTAQTACQTIGHAIALAHQGNSIMLAPATYTENLTIGISLKVIGSNATTTIVDGGGAGTVFTISNAARVRLSNLTIRNGSADAGGGINNAGTLTINNSTISGNGATGKWGGGGIFTSSNLTINNSTISNNTSSLAYAYGGGIFVYGGTATINRSTVSANQATYGGGIAVFSGTVAVNRSTLSGNQAAWGGGHFNNYYATLTTITNSTISNNDASNVGGGFFNWSTIKVNNSTLSGNGAAYGGGIESISSNPTTLQNTIVANSPSGGNCFTDYGATITSDGYNLSSDNTCNFNGPGDMNNTYPKLGMLGNHGGPTQTIPLLLGSPAIDAGNPSGCTDGNGNLLKIDQRGYPRPDKEDTGGCDMGAYERQKH